MRIARALVIAGGGLLIAAASRAQSWERIGPEGGAICALAAAPSKPSVLYAGGADAGVFRSLDRGTTWSFAGAGLGPEAVCSLAVDARRPLRLWAISRLTLFRSRDGGATWTALATPAPDDLHRVVAHPLTSNLIYVQSSAGVRRSRDGGDTWSGYLGHLPPRFATDLIVDALRPDHLYAANGAQVSRSLDGGRTWTEIFRGLFPNEEGWIDNLAIAEDGRTLYAGSVGHGLYRSPDRGDTWQRVSLAGGVHAVATSGRRVYVAGTEGLAISADRGRSFPPVARRLAGEEVAEVLALPHGVLAGSRRALYVSRDAGATFALAQRGLRARAWSELEIDPLLPSLWYAVDIRYGVLRSPSAGAVWRRGDRGLDDPFASWQLPTFLQLDAPDSRLYTRGGAALARSEDGARSWQELVELSCALPSGVLVDAPRGRLLLASFPLISGCQGCTLHRSLDDGATFDCARSLVPQGGTILAVHPPSGDLLASSFGGLVRSADWAESWTPVSDLKLHALQISARNPDLFRALAVDAAGAVELRRSTDQGLTWDAPVPGPPGELYLDPGTDERLYALTPHQLFVSDDAGATWQTLGASFPDGRLSDLAFAPRQPDAVFAAATGGGLVRLRFAP